MESLIILILSCLLCFAIGSRVSFNNGYRRGIRVGLAKAKAKAERFTAMSTEQQQQYLQMKIDAKAQRMIWRLEDEAKERQQLEKYFRKGLKNE